MKGFAENPYFTNEVLYKEVILNEHCDQSTRATPIKWKAGMVRRILVFKVFHSFYNFEMAIICSTCYVIQYMMEKLILHPFIHLFIDCVGDNYLFLYSHIPKTFLNLFYTMTGPDSAVQSTEHVKRTEERP